MKINVAGGSRGGEVMMVDELGDETREIGRDLALRPRIGITFECK